MKKEYKKQLKGFGVEVGEYHLNSKGIFTLIELPTEFGDWMIFSSHQEAVRSGIKLYPANVKKEDIKIIPLY